MSTSQKLESSDEARLNDSPWKTFYQKKKIVITGSSGYLGTSLVAKLASLDCEITRLSRSGNFILPPNPAARFNDKIADIRNKSLWHDLIPNTDIIFHLAAQTSVPFSEKNPAEDFAANVFPVIQILEAARETGKKVGIVFSGTVTQAGIPQMLPVDETHPDRPITFYDLHKLMAEQYLKLQAAQGLVRAVSLRLSNVYGPGPASSSPDRGILNQILRKALAQEKLLIYGKGDHLRDYLYIEDALRAFLLAGIHLDKLSGQHFVIGSGKGHTLWDTFNLAADLAKNLTGVRIPVESVEPPVPLSLVEKRNFVADSSRFSELTGWFSAYSFEQGLDATLKYFYSIVSPAEAGNQNSNRMS